MMRFWFKDAISASVSRFSFNLLHASSDGRPVKSQLYKHNAQPQRQIYLPNHCLSEFEESSPSAFSQKSAHQKTSRSFVSWYQLLSNMIYIAQVHRPPLCCLSILSEIKTKNPVDWWGPCRNAKTIKINQANPNTHISKLTTPPNSLRWESKDIPNKDGILFRMDKTSKNRAVKDSVNQKRYKLCSHAQSEQAIERTETVKPYWNSIVRITSGIAVLSLY